MRIGLRFGIGPLRVYIPLASTGRRARYWRHGTCPIHHRTRQAADRCRNH